MDNAQAKTKHHDDVDALQPDAWQSGHTTQLVRHMEPAIDLSLRSFRTEAEIQAINCALQKTGWNRKRAAKLLSISYRCLLYKIRQHNLTPTVQHG
jgi:DNA-binding NtrC family response regulator